MNNMMWSKRWFLVAIVGILTVGCSFESDHKHKVTATRRHCERVIENEKYFKIEHSLDAIRVMLKKTSSNSIDIEEVIRNFSLPKYKQSLAMDFCDQIKTLESNRIEFKRVYEAENHRLNCVLGEVIRHAPFSEDSCGVIDFDLIGRN